MFVSRLGTNPDPGKDHLVCLHEEGGAWPFPMCQAAAWLYEELPARFDFEELMQVADRQGLAGENVAAYVREWQRFEMILVHEGTFTKRPEARPYF